jgi:hypothetical protein
MTRRGGALIAGPSGGLISWLVWGAIGPAGVFIPVNWATDKLAGAALHWFKRCTQMDDLSRLVKAAAGPSARLSRRGIKRLGKLLEDEQTWCQLAGSDVTHLTDRIAACLPSGAREAAGAIARGLLEFAVFDLQPAVFQKVVQARLQQMTEQASALDEALFRMHEDLYHRVDEVKDLVKLVSDQLPPGPASLGEIKIYLKGLIDWLNTDPWPRDQRLGGPVLTPAVIERKLRVGAADPAREQDADADELARQCSRLVILGGPGSGKTWLAMRTARICAEEALKALEDYAPLDKVELPLYTTCSRLSSTSGDIREAAVSSALNWIGDLGGSRIVKALCLSFTERKQEPTLLIIDSLDEASDAGEARDRLRQAGSLKQPWRVVLTSRPSSWDNQLTIEEANQAHRVGELQPLRYPDDVEPVIGRWFADHPQRSQALAAQIARRPGLQQASTVPLILAFYCILGASKPLPEFRHELYERVVNRMLRSPWRSSSGPLRDVAASREALRTWAWRGAKNDRTSGVGQWEDDIPTEDAQLSPAEQDAVDHIAAPRSGPDFDTDETLRRFVHRSIREHLVAEHVASLPVGQAVRELLPHLWYDPDWEYTAPAAIAMHDEHDAVLRALICDAAGRPDEIPGDLSVIDAGGQMLRLLARVAAESRESAWSPELASAIGEARVELARSGNVYGLGEAAHWPTSNRQARNALLGQLDEVADSWVAARLAGALIQLEPTDEDNRQAIGALLRQLTGNVVGWGAARLASTLVQLEPEPDDKRQARNALLTHLAEEPGDGELADALAQLDPTPDDKSKGIDALLGRLPDQDFYVADEPVTAGLVQLAQTPQDKQQARERVLGRLAGAPASWTAARLVGTLVQLEPEPDDKRQARGSLLALLTGYATGAEAKRLADAFIELAQTPDDKHQAVNEVLVRLGGQVTGRIIESLAPLVLRLDPEPDDKRQALVTVLAWLAGQATDAEAARLAPLVIQLDPGPDDKRQALDTLLVRLTSQARRAVTREQPTRAGQPATSRHDAATGEWPLFVLFGQSTRAEAADLAAAVLLLDPEPDDRRQARNALLTLLSNPTTIAAVAGDLATVLLQLDPEPDDQRQARSALLTQLAAHATGAVTHDEAALWLFADQTRGSLGAELAALVLRLDPEPDDKRKALDAVLTLLTNQATGEVAANLAATVVRLDPGADDQRTAIDAVLTLLIKDVEGRNADGLARALVQLDARPDDKRKALDTLLGLLTGRATGAAAEAVAAGLTLLDATAEDRRRARDALLGKLSGRPHGTVIELVSVVLQLVFTPGEKRQVLDAVLSLLGRETDSAVAAALIRGVAQLDPTARDLSSSRAWAAPPTAELLAEARRNSALDEWLAALPSLSPLSP